MFVFRAFHRCTGNVYPFLCIAVFVVFFHEVFHSVPSGGLQLLEQKMASRICSVVAHVNNVWESIIFCGRFIARCSSLSSSNSMPTLKPKCKKKLIDHSERDWVINYWINKFVKNSSESVAAETQMDDENASSQSCEFVQFSCTFFLLLWGGCCSDSSILMLMENVESFAVMMFTVGAVLHILWKI